MKSPVIKRSIVIAGHKTSVSIEDAFWTALKDIAQARRQSVAELIGAIDGARHRVDCVLYDQPQFVAS